MPDQQPLNDRMPVTNSDGTPTQYFIRVLKDAGLLTQEKAKAADLKALKLGSLLDVDTITTPPVNGQTLVFDSALQKWKPGTAGGGGGAAASAAFYWNGSAVVVLSSSNISSIVRNSAGIYTFTFASPFANVHYTFTGSGKFTNGSNDQNTGYFAMYRFNPRTTSSVTMLYLDTLGNNLRDPQTSETDVAASIVFFAV